MIQNIKTLHLEPTDVCNAACPQCARTISDTFKDNQTHLTVEQIANQIDVTQLHKAYLCGVYGDPAAGKHTLDILKFLREQNNTITLGMHSNGGLRSKEWWGELATIINRTKDYAVFSIDGLEDTNHIYRINTQWNIIIQNAKEYINNGGNAHWEMLVYEHNQHQVDEAQQLAHDLGFKFFRAKVSRRFDFAPVKFLNPPKGWTDPVVTSGKIECGAIKDSSVYISADGIVRPCCWLFNDTLDNFDIVQNSWNTEQPNSICKQTCSNNGTGTSFTNQWQREVELNE